MLGFVMACMIVVSAGMKSGWSNLGFRNFLIFICLILYPLGIVYNFRNVWDSVLQREHHAPADRYYTRKERDIHDANNFITRIMKIGITCLFGWIPGVHKSYKYLQYLKREQL